jgi:mono/diheme cytochrome c family protein
MKIKTVFFLLMPAFLLISCADNVSDPGNTNPDPESFFNSQVLPIFTQSCASCHGGSGGVNLNTFNNIVNASGNKLGRSVIAGDADASPLYQLLLGPVGSVPKMPIGSSLSETQINTIKTWIDNGATND